MSEEIWKDIPDYEGIYEASTKGRIRTKEGKTTYTKRHGVRHWKSRILKPKGINPTTGYRVSLWKDGTHKDWLVARLTAITFLGKTKQKMTVNHKDGNRFNNNIENLEWLTLADNIRHGFENGLYPCIEITLVSDEGKTIKFKSLSEAGRYLKRNHGYLSLRISKALKTCTSADGKEYTIKSYKKTG